MAGYHVKNLSEIPIPTELGRGNIITAPINRVKTPTELHKIDDPLNELNNHGLLMITDTRKLQINSNNISHQLTSKS